MSAASAGRARDAHPLATASPLQQAHALIEQHYALPWTVCRLARRIRLPRFAFQKAYALAYGLKPMEHLRRVRAQHALRLIEEGHAPEQAARLTGARPLHLPEVDAGWRLRRSAALPARVRRRATLNRP